MATKLAAKRAALYLRSSKDRSDVSIDSQRRELEKLAKEKNILIVENYQDVVESAKDENRPGFQKLFTDLTSSKRTWNTLMMVDTSRLSRRRHMAQVFKHQANKHGVQIIFSKLPDVDPLVDMVIQGVMEVFDEMHSWMAREKGLAGMEENINRGFRAGGRAPKGYRLQKINTGTIREGEEVTKTKLVLTEDSIWVGKYLKERAIGRKRSVICRTLNIEISDSTLVGMEWNALTYAGCTTWNVHQEHGPDGYKGGVKRRPREEWKINEGTHEALISIAEAEAILKQLQDSNASQRRRTPSKYLLTGVLISPDGVPWYGDGAGMYYRCGKGRKVQAQHIDQSVITQMAFDFTSPEFVSRVTKLTRKKAVASGELAEIKNVQSQIVSLNGKINRLMDLIPETTAVDVMLRRVESLEGEREALSKVLNDLNREAESGQLLSNITEKQVAKLLAGIAVDFEGQDRESLKDFISNLVDKIIMDPEQLSCWIHYKIPTSTQRWDSVASPRGFEPRLPP